MGIAIYRRLRAGLLCSLESAELQIVFIGLLDLVQGIQLGSQLKQALLLGFRQIAELALLKLEGEFRDFSGVLLLITSGVDQLNLALVGFLR
ncbi:hypothetical protein D3C81_1639460 [compost metagenome]